MINHCELDEPEVFTFPPATRVAQVQYTMGPPKPTFLEIVYGR